MGEVLTAAGLLVQARSTRRCLFLLRCDCDCWGVPGGHLERGEGALTAAIREFQEETLCARSLTTYIHEAPVRHGGFTLFHAEVARQFRPVLNEEHSSFVWTRPDAPPAPLHPGLAYQIARLGLR